MRGPVLAVRLDHLFDRANVLGAARTDERQRDRPEAEREDSAPERRLVVVVALDGGVSEQLDLALVQADQLVPRP